MNNRKNKLHKNVASVSYGTNFQKPNRHIFGFSKKEEEKKHIRTNNGLILQF